jgi:hypothetical protein
VVKTRVAYIRNSESGDGGAGYYAAQRLATSMLGGTIDWLNARKSSLDLPDGSIGYDRVVTRAAMTTSKEES